jgi:DNA-binding GntR family transcriptional regulator
MDMPESLPDGADQKTVVAEIQSRILERICFLDYPPGGQLKESVLAKEFGVSRTPVRDALSRISHLGLVETRNGVGTVVVALSRDEIAQVYEMRLHLATLIGRLSPVEIRQAHKDRAYDLLQRARRLAAGFDPREYVVLNHRLNHLIIDLIGNASLRSFWRQTYFQAASTWHRVAAIVGADVARSLVDELVDINTALAQNDVEALGYLQRIHIGYGYQRIKQHLLD